MKKTFVLLTLLLFVISFAYTQDVVNLNFKFQFFDSREGFVKLSKLVIKANGKKIGESPAKLENIENKVSVQLPKGNYEIDATVYSMYNGVWVERTEANDYTMDCKYIIDSLLLESDNNITLTFNAVTGFKNIDIEEIDVENTSNSSIENPNTTSNNSTQESNYKTPLNELNTFLNTYYNPEIDNNVEKVNTSIYFNFLVDGDNYSYSIKIADLKKYVTVNVTDSEVKLQCNNNQKLFYSTFADATFDNFSFKTPDNSYKAKLSELLSDFIKAL